MAAAVAADGGSDGTAQQQQQQQQHNQHHHHRLPGSDCLSCRMTGVVVCVAASAYLMAQTYARPPASPIQRHVTLAVAGGFAALAVVRALL